MSTRLIAYYRVSAVGDRAGESFQSIAQQRDAVAAIVKLTPGARVVDEVEALNASGGKTWPEPKLAEAVARVDAGHADGVVVYALDRWGRHMQALEVVERWAEQGKTFLSASDKFDAATPSGRMALRMMMVVARYYWESARDRFAVSQQRASARGVYIGPAPVGYRKDKHGALELDPKTSRVVREAFRIAARDGMHAAGDHLAAALPGKRWEKSDIRRVLKNRAYLGEHHAGGLGHAAITTPAIFEAAQSESRGRRSNGDYPLTHVATCANCGAGLVGALQTVRDKQYRRMRCSATCAGGVGSVSAGRLEALVRDALRPALADKEFRLGYEAGDVEGAEAALELAESRLTRYLEDVETRDEVGEVAWRAGRRSHVDAVKKARGRLAEVAASSARSERLPAAHELDDPEQFARALAVIGRLEVAGGRGPVDFVERGGRVTFGWLDVDELDDGVGVLAA